MQRLRAPLAPVGVAAIALAASLIRWYLQSSGNLYTALDKRFYVPDPDLGWRVSKQHPIWLGLDACAVIFALALILAGAAAAINRRERKRQTRSSLLRGASWTAAVGCACIPAVAFATGPGPLHATDTLPPAAIVKLENGLEGSLEAPPGTYAVVDHTGTAVTAHLSAGGEAFDARFADITGSWRGIPGDLAQPMLADIRVTAASIDTGIAERSKHAREGYLHADEFPLIRVTFDRMAAVRPNGGNGVAFRAPGAASLMGRTHAIEITGTVVKLDPPALARLGLAGDVLLVQADFALPIRETALAKNAHDFDGERIPVHVSLVLRHTGV